MWMFRAYFQVFSSEHVALPSIRSPFVTLEHFSTESTHLNEVLLDATCASASTFLLLSTGVHLTIATSQQENKKTLHTVQKALIIHLIIRLLSILAFFLLLCSFLSPLMNIALD